MINRLIVVFISLFVFMRIYANVGVENITDRCTCKIGTPDHPYRCSPVKNSMSVKFGTSGDAYSCNFQSLIEPGNSADENYVNCDEPDALTWVDANDPAIAHSKTEDQFQGSSNLYVVAMQVHKVDYIPLVLTKADIDGGCDFS